jgi:hypothetical protein
MAKPLDQPGWIAKKNELRDTYGYIWLPVLRWDLPTIDDVIRKAIGDEAKQLCHYDAYRVEKLLADISRLLDRIFSYRKEGYDLDIAATTWALEYQLFKDQLDRQISLEQLAYVGEQREKERDAQKKAADAFAVVNHPLAQGFSEAASGSSASSGIAVQGESDRRNVVKLKWDRLSKHQDDLELRHKLPGGSMNFIDRLDRLQGLLVEDVQEAYQKAVAARAGLKALFGIDLPFPAVDDNRFLDKFLSWTRLVIRQLEIDQQDDVEFDHIIPLVQLQGDGKLSGVIAPAIYMTAMNPNGDGKLTVDLTNYFTPAPLGKMWLRGVGLSFSDADPSQETHRLYRLSAQVFPPPAQDLFSQMPNNTIPRTPILLSNISMTNPNEPAKIYRGPNIDNLDPRGTWTVKINSTLGFPNVGRQTRNAASIPDIKLHLAICARPEKSIDKWPTLNW